MLKSYSFSLIVCTAMLLFFSKCKSEETPLLTMENGYQYRHHIQNEGPKPQPGQVAYYYFVSKADDSLMMDGRDASMVSKLQIPNLPPSRKSKSPTLEAIKLMSIGDSLTVIVPYDSLPEMPPSFGKYKNLYYDLTLIDIKSLKEFDRLEKEEKLRNTRISNEIDEFAKKTCEEYEAGLLSDQIIEKPSGLKYIIHEEGEGTVPVEGDIVQVKYHGRLVSGDMFDNNFDKSYTLPIKVGAVEIRVVEGWKEALFYLKRGTKATLFVPYQLGYGEQGVPGFIPPKAELAYYIELVK